MLYLFADEVGSIPVTPLFATQPIPNEARENFGSPSERGIFI